MPHLSLHTQAGAITLFEADSALVALEWGWAPDGSQTPLLRAASDQLHAYFDGEATDFDLPLNPVGTPYRQRVWQALRAIPYGATRTYGDIVRVAGGSPRSVGQANASNPLPILIPCHRVLAAGHLGGYSGGDGLATKRLLLALEQPAAIARRAAAPTIPPSRPTLGTPPSGTPPSGTPPSGRPPSGRQGETA